VLDYLRAAPDDDMPGAPPLDRLRRLARRPGVWILAVIGLALLVTAVLRARGPVVTTAQAARKDLEQHLVANGRVRVVTRMELSAQASGRVVTVPAVEGRRVRAGDLLVQLDDREARAEVAQARAAVGQAAARLEQTRQVNVVVATEASRQAATNLARAEDELARLETLFRAGAVARADVDEARRDVEIMRARQAAAAAEQTAAMPLGADTRVALNAQRESEARLAAAQTRLTQTRIVAPQDGVVLVRAVEPGDTAQPGVTLIELAGDGETQLVIEPDERNLAWIRPDQAARASADAFPQPLFDARVCYIAPAVDPRRGSVEVRLCVPQPPGFLKPDMTVSVDLTVASKRQVVTVPSGAVRDASTAAPWVYAVQAGRLVRQDVGVGIRGEGETEIQSGLAEGDEVVLTGERRLDAGQRVRTRPETR
jgi:HlyD family secretion protein